MFQHLTDFKHVRSAKEAAGFYIAYLVLVMIVSGLVAGVGSAFLPQDNPTFDDGYNMGLKVGGALSVIFSVALAFVVLKAKGLLGSFGFILLAVLAGFLALVGGGLLGLIPVAYMTTRGEKQATLPGISA